MVDISLSALRMGARKCNLVCLERREEMPAALEEIEEAEEEGIIMHPGFGPKRIIGKDGKVMALETLKTKWVFDQNKRFNPAFYENSESQIECDTIIMAIGQAPRLDFLTPEDNVDFSPRGLIAVNPQTLMTSAAGIFAGGDCVFGPRLIIDSVGDGKRAAVGIDEFLRGGKHPEPVIEVEVLEAAQHAAGLSRPHSASRFRCFLWSAAPALPKSKSATTHRRPWPRRSAVCTVGSTRFSKARRKTAACAFCAAAASMFARKNVWSWFRSTASSSSLIPCSTFATTSECFGVEFDEVSGRRTRRGYRLGDVERRDPLHSLWPLRHALSSGHDHYGVLQPDSCRTDRSDFGSGASEDCSRSRLRGTYGRRKKSHNCQRRR